MTGLPAFGLPLAVSALRWVRSIEEFDGPILTEYADDKGGVYLEKWCAQDATSGVVRSLRVATRHRAIAEYMAGRTSLRTLLTQPNQNAGFLVDVDRAGTIVAGFLVDIQQLPSEYLPDDDAMHDDSLRPRTGTIREMFLLDGNWDGGTIARLERRYIDVAAFAHCTRPLVVGQPPQYKFSSGWAYGSAFATMRARMPRALKPKSATVEANSPGVLAIDAPAATAEMVLDALRRAKKADAITAYDTLHDWTKLRYEVAETKLELQRAEKDLRALCAQLDVEVTSVWIAEEERPHHSILTAGKLVAAYYRRLWEVLTPAGAEFVRPEFASPPAAPDSVLVAEDEDEDLRW